MNYRIVSDSGSNLKTVDSDIAYVSVPLKISTEEREFVDDDALQVGEMISYLDGYKGKSGTACPGVGQWLEAFGDAEAVFCFTITSALSGSCNAARLAGEEYEEEHPGRHVCIVDSLSAGQVRIDHCCNKPAAEKLKQILLEEYADADIRIGETFGLCSFYAEQGVLLIGFERS